ncbi:hypothetical protein [Brevibacterium sp. VCM10]|uniref:hypothetical protein n=1 Tax=Brevibacterium sp. VCM10 TaxID=1381751 RepID=UPI0004723F28|nr:hypothetical protein [Brevibacterium sp. VCM10]
MSEPDSPVLRLIPYLAAISAAIFAGLAMAGTGESNLLVTLVVAGAGYFGAYFIVKLIIHVLVTRIDSGSNDDHG